MAGIIRLSSIGVALGAWAVLTGTPSAQAADTVIPLKGPGAGKVTAKLVVQDDPDDGRTMSCEVRIRRGFRAAGYILLSRTFADPDLTPQGRRLDFVQAKGRRSVDLQESAFYVRSSGVVTCKIRMTLIKRHTSARARGKVVVALDPPAAITL